MIYLRSPLLCGVLCGEVGIESKFRLTVAQTFEVYKTPKRGGTAPVKKAEIQRSGHETPHWPAGGPPTGSDG
jgi:hypothetical protein